MFSRKLYLLLFILITPTVLFAAEESHAIDWTNFYWRIAMFILFILTVLLLAGKKISKLLNDRTIAVRQTLEDAMRMKGDAVLKLEEHRVKMNRLNKDLEDMKRSSKEAAKLETEMMLADANKQIESMHAHAKIAIENEISKAILELRREISFQAIDKAEQIFKKEINTAKSKKISENYIKNIG